MKSRITSFLFLFLWLAAASSQSNVGTEFGLSFMEHVDRGDNNMVVMISSTVATTGMVEMPNQGFSSSFSVNVNDVVLINLPAGAETLGSREISDNGIRMTSQLPISVYMHQYSRFRSHASFVLPVDALSNEYFVLCYSGISGFNNNSGWSEFLVVATQDETTVLISPSDNTTHGIREGNLKQLF